jgi:hypothetical protein
MVLQHIFTPFFFEHELKKNHTYHNLYYSILAKGYCVILILYGDDVFMTRDDDHKLFMVE